MILNFDYHSVLTIGRLFGSNLRLKLAHFDPDEYWTWRYLLLLIENLLESLGVAVSLRFILEQLVVYLRLRNEYKLITYYLGCYNVLIIRLDYFFQNRLSPAIT
jgi:hypothetical protein